MRGSERETFCDGTFCKWAGSMLAMKHCVESYVTAADGCILTHRQGTEGAGQINKHRGGGGG
jgi:hypothetical protein